MTQANADFGDLLSTTLRNYSNQLTDNIFESFVLTKFLEEKNQIRVEGGVSLVEQVLIGENTTVGWYNDTETVTAPTVLTTEVLNPATSGGSTNQGQITALEFQWKQLEGAVGYTAMEVTKNRGNAQLLKLLEQRITIAEQSMKGQIERALIGGQYNGSNVLFADTKAPHGLKNVLTKLTARANNGNAKPGEQHSYGGVPYNATAAEIDWIQPSVYAKSTDGIGTSLDTEAIEKVITDLDRGGTDGPDLVITSNKQWRSLSTELRGKLQFYNTTTGDGGFRHFMAEGLPVFYFSQGYTASSPTQASPWDEDHVAILNCNYLKLVKHETDWMQNFGFQQIDLAPRWQTLLRSVMQFYCVGRKYQGLINYN